METIKEILMRRDGMSAEAADELILQAKDDLDEKLINGEEEAGDICEIWFGLEPDYIFELI